MIELDRERMRALGYRIVDRLVEHHATLKDQRVTGRATRATLEAMLCDPLPETPVDPEHALETLDRVVFGHMMRVNHPRFFAFVPSPGNFAGAMAEALAAGFNIFQGTWLASSGPSALELKMVDWLRRECGLPETAGGQFLSGGSMANLTALAVARHRVLGGRMDGAVAYYSDQTHSCVERALRVLGFGPEQLRKLACDDACRLPLDRLERAVAEDRAAGRRPFCVIANVGTTNTAAIDPLPGLADFCAREGLWLHADGAYGAAAALCPRGRALLAGMERVDSLVLDPHKWLFMPIEIGCVLVREGGWLRECFQILPDYLRDAHKLHGEFNFCDHGVQLTRSFRTAKLWFSLQVFGLRAFREAIEWGFELAEEAERRLRASGLWRVVTPAQLAMVSFEYAPEGVPAEAAARVNGQLVEAMFADGFAMLSSTLLRGKTVLRLCTINPRTTMQDIRLTVDRLELMAGRLQAAVAR